MTGQYKTVNLEEGRPTVDLAIRRLTFEINRAKAGKIAALKLIHGFGSSGTGGRIRTEARKYLALLERRGTIRLFVTGEDFSIFSADTRKLIDLCPDLRSDRDLDSHNNGITIVML